MKKCKECDKKLQKYYFLIGDSLIYCKSCILELMDNVNDFKVKIKWRADVILVNMNVKLVKRISFQLVLVFIVLLVGKNE